MAGSAQLVQQLLGAARAGDAEGVQSLVTDDFVWRLPGRGRIAGDARGADGLIERLQTVLGAGVRPQLLDVLEGDGHVAVLQHNQADANGRRLDVRVVNLYTVREGRIARQETFFSDQEHADRFWA